MSDEIKIEKDLQPEGDEVTETTFLTIASDEDDGSSEGFYRFKLIRDAQRALQPSKMKDQAEYIMDRILAGNRSKRWMVNYSFLPEVENSLLRQTRYTMQIDLQAITPNDKSRMEAEVMIEILAKAATTQRWQLIIEGSTEPEFQDKQTAQLIIPDDWYKAYFSHIYERDAQIEILQSSIEAGIESKFENRFHCVLYGPPACGKTEITRTFKEMFGDDACLEYDATSTSQAGAIKDLAGREVLPQLLIVEEIEKTDENSLRWLLSVLDHRAEIRKTNYRESIEREVKLICIATVNDYDLFCKLMYGALASRFTHHIYCPRPDPIILKRILQREINKLDNGNEKWIEPAVKYATDRNITDPRKVTAICLCGRDELLTGEYQKKLDRCLNPSQVTEVVKIDAAIKDGIKPKFKINTGVPIPE